MIHNIGIDFLHYADKQILYFDSCCKRISKYTDLEQAQSELNELYQFLKDITPEYIQDGKISEGYKYFISSLLECESSLRKTFIIESTPNYNPEMLNLTLPVNSDINDKLNWLVYMTRKHLFSLTSNNIYTEDFANCCKTSCIKINELSKKIGLKSTPLIIYPGFDKRANLYQGSGYHYLNLVTDGVKEAYIDCTYRQFFKSTTNNLNRLGIVELSGCRAGIFMTMNEERLNLAKQILKNGWFWGTDENVKNYFDGFALSFRNGLYYLESNDYSYTTNYTALDYKRFLNGVDSQIKHESVSNLGFQRTLKPKDKK